MGSVNEAIPEPPSTEIFTPLNRKKNETRLISLLPATFGSPKIKCELQIISLDNPPSYPALSYVWGDHSDAKEILLNGIPYKVTANLHYALLHLRRADKPLIIWIDALCINQDDLFERNHQVSLMHLLYGNADHVIVWLGKESDDSDQAMDFIESLGNSISIRNNDNSSMVVDITSASSRSNWTAVVNILRRDWWTRLWVFQEIVLAQKAIFICGTKQVDWTCFNALAQKQDKSDPFPDNPSKDSLDLSYQVILAIKGIETISDAKTLGSTPLELSSRFDFITILLFSQERNASDPRDKVFGMLGILNQGMKMDPDYEKTAEEVYMELTVNFFERTKRLDHLQLAGYGIRSNDAEITLPTWALDLRAGSSIISLPLSAAFNADGEDEVIGVSFNTSLRELAVQAVVLDELEISSGAQIWMETNLNQMLKWKKLVDVRKVNPAPAGVPFLQAFYRVMIPDHAHLDEYGVFGFTLHFYIHMFQNLGVDIHNLQFPDFEVFKRQVMEPFPGGEGASVFEVYFGRPPAPEDTIGSLEYVYHYAHRIRFPWCLNVHMFCSGHYFFITDRGYMGIGPIEIKRGDHLAVISGCNLPMVLRKCSIGKYQLMGPCYVFGLMNGEVVRLTQEGNIHWESIILI